MGKLKKLRELIKGVKADSVVGSFWEVKGVKGVKGVKADSAVGSFWGS